MSNHSQDMMDDEDLNEEEIVQAILKLGNDVLKNLGVEEQIDDVGVFFSDAFYIQFFQAAFPEIDFSDWEEGQNEDEMANNIQNLIDLLGEQILKYDLSHIKGNEIVQGNPEHCINLLQLVLEISGMLQGKQDAGEGQDNDSEDGFDYGKEFNDSSSNMQRANQQMQMEEDDEAQIIHEKKTTNNQAQQNISPLNPQSLGQVSSKKPSNKKGRSYSDDRGRPQFEIDDIDISNEFDVNMDDDDDDDELVFKQQEQQFQKQNDQSINQQEMIKKQQEHIIDDYGEDNDEEIDEEDLKMYEQFLANNKQQEHQLAMLVNEGNGNDVKASGNKNNQQPQFEEDDDDDEEIDLDNIDYDDLDPQILELAEQMGVHPKEVIKQMLKMQQEGYGDEDGEGEDEDEEDEHQQLYNQQQLQSSNKKNNQTQQQQQQQVQKQQQQIVKQKLLPHEMIQQDDEDESYYSEGELISRDKLANKKSYSAPYIIINDCFDEPLYDSEDEKENDSANTTTILKNLEMQEQYADQMGEDREELDEQTAQLLMMQQQQMMAQQQQQKQISNVTEVSKSKESSSQAVKMNKSSDKKQKMQQQYYQHDDDDDDELEIDVGQKLQQLQQQQQQQFIQQNDDQEGEGEDEGEDDDEDMLIDLDQLDETNRQILLEYLQQEYEKNPGQFPFPKELLESHLAKQQQQKQQSQGRQETESVRDIKSDEMIVEDVSQQKNVGQIEGGGQDVESQNDQDQNQQYEQDQQDYGQELDEEQQQQLMLMQQQMYQQQMMMQQQQQLQQSKPKKGTKKGIRPKSGGKKKQNLLTQQQQMQMMHLQNEQEQQEVMLDPQQQQMLAQLIQDQQIDIENLDPNILQQLIVAQSQAQQQQMMQQQLSRPKSAKRKSSATKKKPKNLQKLMPYQAPKNLKVLGPSTPGIKSFNTNRSYNQTFSKKKMTKRSAKKQSLTNNPSQQQYLQPGEEEQLIPQMPMLSEEYLNQLSEEQLQQLLEQQQQLMMMQQQQQQQQLMMQQNSQMRKSSRPKSAKPSKALKQSKIPQTYASYYQPLGMNSKRKSTGKGKKKKKKKTGSMHPQIDHQGVLMNNYFPALEGGGQLIGNSQTTEEGGNSLTKDSKYPKFSHDIINNPAALAMLNGINQEQIDEVPPEQEEGESQELIQKMPNFYPQQQMLADQDQIQEEDEDEAEDEDGQQMQDNGQDQDIDQDAMNGMQNITDGQFIDQDQMDPNGGEQSEEIELTDEQLIQLIQNAHNLSPEQQQQLQIILQQKMKNEMIHERAKSYQNIYQILMDNVRKAKDRLANLGIPHGSIDDVEETDRRILRQKQEFEALYKLYHHDMKQKQTKKKMEDNKSQKKIAREIKIQSIKERKFQEELLNHQKSLNFKRNAQQVRLCQKVYKLASDLEKNKLLAEKKEFKENLSKKKQQSKMMIDALENYYKNMIDMLKDKIENERFERKIAQQAQQQAMAKMKKELNYQKRSELERYMQLLKQEDQRYDFESTNLQKIEQEIIRLYKK